jgi:predicted nuclease with TOPRIM domain
MNVHVTNQSAKHAKDCFILADGKHYIKRIHIDQARFKYAYDDAVNVKALRTRFDELKEAIEDIVSISPLGL